MDLDYGKNLEHTSEFGNNSFDKVDNYGNALGFGASAAEKNVRSETNETDNSGQWTKKDSKKASVGLPSDNTSEDLHPDAKMLYSMPTALNIELLAKRDQQAIEFHNSQLLEGDTLVFIDYPIDSSDFKGLDFLNSPHRVHSENLLATGSVKFKKLLLSPTYQYKMLRRHKLVNKKLSGIKYIIDLTPPEEGDDALLLVANLSCSFGIQMWHTSCDRMEIMPELVSGEDDLDIAKNIATRAISFPRLSLSPQRTTSNDSPQSDIPSSTPLASDSWFEQVKQANQAELQQAIELSKNEAKMRTKLYAANTRSKQPVPEYCRIRHRAAIVRLLRILERKNPHLDSAPKIWSLFRVAEYLECLDSVKDFILQWILGNSQIVEILPEVCLKMAFGMKNQLLCRAAFAVLVSEEALSLTSRELLKTNDDHGRRNQFGRLREDIDEDIRTRVEYASKSFNESIALEFMNILDVSWLNELPEFQKLQRFLESVTSQTNQVDTKRKKQWLESVNDLISNLQNYVRGFILSAALLDFPCDMLDDIQLGVLNKHRLAEMYKPGQTPSIGLFRDIYNSMDHRERIMTPFVWRFLRGLDWLRPKSKDLKWDSDSTASIAEQYGIKKFSTAHISFHRNRFNSCLMEAKSLNVLDETSTDLIQDVSAQPLSKFNNFEGLLEKILIALEATSSPQGTIHERLDLIFSKLELDRLTGNNHLDIDPTNSNDQGSFWDLNWEIDFEEISKSDEVKQNSNIILPIRPKEITNPQSQEGYQDFQNVTSEKHPEMGIQVPASATQPPRDINISESSPYFGAGNFFLQVKSYVQQVCDKILSNSSMGIDVFTTDTLLCLGPEEFKYLPLWAGGDDDESGGVFDPNIPTAEAGPTGPGPAYHTGISLASAPASEGGSLMSSVNTSIGVEDGYSDNVDRRRVLSEDENDFHSETFSYNADDYTISNYSDSPSQPDPKGKGKAVDYYDDIYILRSVSSSATEENARLVSETSVDKEFGSDFGSDFDIKDEGDTNTTVGESDDNNDDDNDDDEDWDGGDIEIFNWGDFDDEMTFY